MASRCRLLALGVLIAFLAAWCRADIPPELVLQAKQATALVDVEEKDGVEEGSAFCIDAAGLFVTNAHVVEAREIGGKVLLVLRSGEKDQTKVFAHLVMLDKEADLAILQADKPLKLTPLLLGSTQGLVETMSVVAFGYPFGSDLAAKEGDFPSITVSMGHVTALRKVNGTLNAIQLDASLNPGNSGGPVLDSKGEVLAIVKEGIPGSGVNFAIPVDYLRAMLLRSHLSFTPPPVSSEHLLDNQEFHIQLLAPSAGKEAVTVEMTLSADAKDQRHFLATSTDGRDFIVTAPLLPVRKGPEDLQISMWSRGVQIVAHVPDQNIRIGGKEVTLSRIKLIERTTDTVTLTDSQILHGRVTGLNAMEIEINGTRSTQNLGQFEILEIAPPAAPTSVNYQITAKQAGKILGEQDGSISLINKGVESAAPQLRPRSLTGFEIVISCFDSNDIRRFDAQDGAYLGDLAVGNGIKGPQDMQWGPDGNLYISTAYTNSVRRINGKTGKFIDAFVKEGSGGLNNAQGIDWGPDGNLYVASHWTGEVKRYNGRTGAFIDDFVPKGAGGLDRPTGLRFGPDGKLYVASYSANLIKCYNARTGAFLGDFAGGSGLRGPGAIEFGPDGYFYICSCDSSEVKRYDGKTGAFLYNLITGKSGGIDHPGGLLFAPDGTLYVSSKTNTIKRFNGKTGEYLDDFISGNGMIYPGRMLIRRNVAP